MTRAAPRAADGPPGVGRGLVAGALLALVAVTLVALALRPPDPTGQARLSVAPDVGSSAPVTPPTPGGTTPPPAPEPVPLPEGLTIPASDVAPDLVRLGLQADGTVEVPAGGDRAGWFDEGPAPGQPGSSVILGHVDTVAGPAVFERLAELRRGDRIRVRLDDGSVARFAVRRVATYPNADFPAEQVYAGSPHRRALNLVTCGGWYDASLGGWQGNVVVFTELVTG